MLTAIKEGLLGAVKELKKKAEKEDLEDYTPNLKRNADRTYKNAEKMIDSRNYDIKKATSTVDKARYMYEHALTLTPLIKANRKSSHEQIYVEFEKNLAGISSRLGLPE